MSREVSRTMPSVGINSVGCKFCLSTAALSSGAPMGLLKSSARSRVAKRLTSVSVGLSTDSGNAAATIPMLYLLSAT